MVSGQPKVLALIPARGGSKSIPRKNIRQLAGHPLIAYSIAAGLQASSVQRVIVSTDDAEIASIAQSYGADVPFLRPSHLAGDDVADLPVFEQALEWLERNEDYRPDLVVQLRPTSPLRPPSVVDSAVSALISDVTADSVRGVTPSGQNPYKMWRMEEGYLSPLIKTDFPEPYNMPRQNLPDTYWQTGHVEAIRFATIAEKRSLTGTKILPLVIDARYSIDIDTLDQWSTAEWILGHYNLDLVRPTHRNSFPADIRMLVLDFDGVLTDNRVLVLEDGREAVACSRSDGMGLEMLRAQGINVVVLSKETNSVVSARCKKLNVTCLQGIGRKATVFEDLVFQNGATFDQVVYVGNDINDLECMRLARVGVAVADAHPDVLRAADWILTKPGGHGAVRELSDLIIASIGDPR